MKNLIPIIDVGHGSFVDGKYTTGEKKQYEFESGVKIYEGLINRAIGRKLVRKLTSADIPFYSINVWDEDDMSLTKRVKKANNLYVGNENVYGISIHSNAASSSLKGSGTKANGFEIYTSIGETLSDKLAEIAASIYKTTFPNINFRNAFWNKASKEADYSILSRSNCPFFLVENLFFDNEREANYLMSEQGQEDISNCLFKVVKTIYESEI